MVFDNRPGFRLFDDFERWRTTEVAVMRNAALVKERSDGHRGTENRKKFENGDYKNYNIFFLKQT